MDFKSESFCLLLIDFDRFMTSEGTDMLILAITSKTGQSVARNFYLEFFVRERIY